MLYLFVSCDAGRVAAIRSAICPSRSKSIREAIDVGTIDVLRVNPDGDFEQLGFDCGWHPCDVETIPGFLAAVPSPVMAKLPHESRNPEMHLASLTDALSVR